MQGGGALRFLQKCWPRWFLVAMRTANKAQCRQTRLAFPHLPARWIQVTPRCVSPQVAFWGAGGRAAHLWGLPWALQGGPVGEQPLGLARPLLPSLRPPPAPHPPENKECARC